jgi:Stress responsive A/B Barrel Domain
MTRYALPGLCLLTLCTLTAPASAAEDKKTSATPFVHTVIFYLKADAPSGVADQIITDCHDSLAKISTVRLLRAGKPAEGSVPPTKKDYAVGLMILFDDAAGFKTYADSPQHRQFVTKYLKYFDASKMAIYDFVDAKK